MIVDPVDLDYLAGAPFTVEEVESAVAAVQAAAGWHIAPVQTDTVTLDVVGGEAVLRLPTRKLLSVTSVTDLDNSTAYAASTYRVSLPLCQVCKKSGYWAAGYGRLRVVFSHGFAAWPQDLLPVVAESAAVIRRDQSVRSESAGPFTVNYGAIGPALGAGPLSTGGALDRYSVWQPGIA